MDVVNSPEGVGSDSALLLVHTRSMGYMLQDVWRDDRTTSRTGVTMAVRRHLKGGLV
jgi:hypothetical protein